MSRSLDSDAGFGVLRSYFWPIHAHELKKFLPMLFMMVLICFNYSILRNLKDSILITSSGAEVLPFIKMWVLPMAILLTVIFTKLSNRYSQERVFYIMMSVFLTFFAVFSFILYPLRDTLHPHETAQLLAGRYPSAKWVIALCEYWSFTLFYSMAELWSVIILQVIFWGFANEVTHVNESRRFYSLFSIGSNIAAALAGFFGVLFISSEMTFGLESTILLGSEAMKEAVWAQKLNWIIGLIIVCGLIVIALFRWTNRNVLTDSSFDELHQIKRLAKINKKKNKQSLRDSFAYLKNSKYLLCIAVLVVSYNLSINLVEVIWKDQLRQLYPAKANYMEFMSYLTLCQGVVSTVTAFFMSHIISRCGWTFTALITPITMMVTSIAFFSFLFFRESLGPIVTASMGLTPLAIAVYIGFAQNCFSKAAKYSVFDATKEMTFIPLEHEVKLKGKAAIDGVGSRLGKSGGSMIHTGLLMIFYTLSDSSPYIAVILLVVITGWIIAAKSLGRQFGDLAATKVDATETVHEEVAVAPKTTPEGGAACAS
jgi:ATP:ADP antiporter, AAA family